MRRTVTSILLLLLPACLVGPDHVEPDLELPETWAGSPWANAPADPVELRAWWSVFNDPHLERLIEQAVLSNLDLKEAFARVTEARARRGVESGQYWPDLDATGDYRRTRLSENVSSSTPGTDIEFDDYRAGAEASWEIDLFGRIRRSIEAADAELQASEADFHDVMLTLYADVALTYIEIRTFQKRLRIAEENLEAQAESRDLAKGRVEARAGRALDLSQAEFNLADTKADVPLLEIGLRLAQNRLAILLGLAPGEFADPVIWPQDMQPPDVDVAAGMPAELMRRRPDLRASERRLAAQVARVGVVTADLYPSLSLFGFLGLQATDFPDVFDYRSKVFGFGPSLRWNLFDGDRVRSQIQVEDARVQQALIDHERTLLFALEEVEAAMVSFALERDRRVALQNAVRHAQESVTYATRLYTQGFTDFQNVLDAQRSLLRFQDRLALSEAALAANLVLLYRSLGGGWTVPEDALSNDDA